MRTIRTEEVGDVTIGVIGENMGDGSEVFNLRIAEDGSVIIIPCLGEPSAHEILDAIVENSL